MQVFNGQDTLEIDVQNQLLKVFLTGSQVKLNSLELFKKQATVVINPNDSYALELDYKIPENAKALSSIIISKKERSERLELVQKLTYLNTLVSSFSIPYLHPENIFIIGERIWVGHFGFLENLTPMNFDNDLFLNQYKALALAIVEPRYPFEALVKGALSLKGEFDRQLLDCQTFEEIIECVNQELAKENQSAHLGKAYVSKNWHRILMIFSVFSLIALFILGVFDYFAYNNDLPKQKAIVNAQSSYLTANYNQTLSNLESYSPDSLPVSAKYVLAASSVQLSSLTSVQKQAVMNNLSIKSDNNTLNYWIYTGRGNFNEALNLAKNLGDNTLTYLAYYNLYESTKLNTSMSGSKKQSLLDEYSKEITSLGKTLGLNK